MKNYDSLPHVLSPQHTNEFHFERALVSPTCSKSNKVSLGTQLIQSAI